MPDLWLKIIELEAKNFEPSLRAESRSWKKSRADIAVENVRRDIKMRTDSKVSFNQRLFLKKMEKAKILKKEKPQSEITNWNEVVNDYSNIIILNR
ncbi:4163_t:CDS:2, partial [Rhizophagus irregularis]